MKAMGNLVIALVTVVSLSLALGAGLAGLAMFSSQVALSTVLPPLNIPGWPGVPFWTKWPLWLAVWFVVFLFPSTLVFFERPGLEKLTVGGKIAFWFFQLYMIGIGLLVMTFYLGLTAALPAAGLLVLSHHLRYTTWFPQCVLALTGLLAVFLGWIMIRRSVYQSLLAGNVINIATSRARSAAAGLVEVTGTAVNDSGIMTIISGGWDDKVPENKISDFCVSDRTGTLRVVPVENLSVLFDDGILLRRNGPNRRILKAGDEVYVMGLLEPGADPEEEPVIRAMPLPGGCRLDLVLQRGLSSLNCLAAFYFVMFLNRILPSPFVFVISNLGEQQARKILKRRRLFSLLLGLTWVFAGFLILAAGVVAFSDDGLQYLNHFVWFFSWGGVFY